MRYKIQKSENNEYPFETIHIVDNKLELYEWVERKKKSLVEDFNFKFSVGFELWANDGTHYRAIDFQNRIPKYDISQFLKLESKSSNHS